MTSNQSKGSINCVAEEERTLFNSNSLHEDYSRFKYMCLPRQIMANDIDNNNVNSTLLFATLYVYCIGGPNLPDLTHALPPAAQTLFLHFKVCLQDL